MRYLIAVISLTLFSCNFSNSKTNIKEKLSEKSINNIEVKKSLYGNSLFLSKLQSIDFVNLWNKAEPVESINFKPTYFVKVALTDGNVKTFRVYSKFIKDNSDLCYEISDSTYFNKIFTMKVVE